MLNPFPYTPYDAVAMGVNIEHGEAFHYSGSIPPPAPAHQL